MTKPFWCEHACLIGTPEQPLFPWAFNIPLKTATFRPFMGSSWADISSYPYGPQYTPRSFLQALHGTSMGLPWASFGPKCSRSRNEMSHSFLLGTLWRKSLQKQIFMAEMQFFCIYIVSKISLIFDCRLFAKRCKYFTSIRQKLNKQYNLFAYSLLFL